MYFVIFFICCEISIYLLHRRHAHYAMSLFIYEIMYEIKSAKIYCIYFKILDVMTLVVVLLGSRKKFPRACI